MLNIYPLWPKDLLNIFCPCLTPYYLPLRSNRLGMQVSRMGYEHRSFCLIYPRRPKCRLEELLDLALPQSETCLSPPLTIDEMRPPPLQVLLQRPEELVEVGVQLEEDSVELAAELEEDPSEPKILALKRQSRAILNSQLLWLGLRHGKYGTEVHSPRLKELLTTVRPCSQIFLTLKGS